MDLNFVEILKHYVLQYYGIDWLIALTVFAGLFLIGDKNRVGFIIGMISSVLGLFFSLQIGSIANGITSVILFFLYFRGYLKWKQGQ